MLQIKMKQNVLSMRNSSCRIYDLLLIKIILKKQKKFKRIFITPKKSFIYLKSDQQRKLIKLNIYNNEKQLFLLTFHDIE